MDPRKHNSKRRIRVQKNTPSDKELSEKKDSKLKIGTLFGVANAVAKAKNKTVDKKKTKIKVNKSTSFFGDLD